MWILGLKGLTGMIMKFTGFVAENDSPYVV